MRLALQVLAASLGLLLVLVAADVAARLFLAQKIGPALLAKPGFLPGRSPREIQLRSGADWTVFREDPGSRRVGEAAMLGAATPVCLHRADPPPCPPEASRYGWPGAVAWAASLAEIPGAVWIWKPGAAGDQPVHPERQFFAHAFDLGRAPRGWIGVAADDAAEVRVNGRFVGTIGSVTDETAALRAQMTLTRFDLTPFLHPGTNVITIAAQNGPFVDCGGPCTYARNPAGVVFGGVITDEGPPLD